VTHKGVCEFTAFCNLIMLAAMTVTYLLMCDTNLSAVDKKVVTSSVLPPPFGMQSFQ